MTDSCHPELVEGRACPQEAVTVLWILAVPYGFYIITDVDFARIFLKF